MLENIKKLATIPRICVNIIKYKICLLLENIMGLIDPQFDRIIGKVIIAVIKEPKNIKVKGEDFVKIF